MSNLNIITAWHDTFKNILINDFKACCYNFKNDDCQITVNGSVVITEKIKNWTFIYECETDIIRHEPYYSVNMICIFKNEIFDSYRFNKFTTDLKITGFVEYCNMIKEFESFNTFVNNFM